MILANHGILSSSGGLPPSTLLTNLYAVYKAENNANDSLGVYNGTAQGGLTYSIGKSGNAFTFNGTNAYAKLVTDSFNFTGNFSYSFWLYMPTSLGSAQGLFMNFAFDGSSFYGFGASYDTYLRLRIFNGTGDPGVNDLYFNYKTAGYENSWNLITYTHKSGSNKMYINNTLITSNTSTVNPVYYSNHVPVIGAFHYSSGFSNLIQYYAINNSKIDELSVWNKELTSTEVTDLYNSGSGKFYPY